MPDKPHQPDPDAPIPALDPAKVETPASTDPAETIEEKGEPFEGNFA